MKPPTPETRAERITLYERALALDPGSIEVQSHLANALAGGVLANMTHSAAADIRRAIALSEQALASSPNSPLAHNAKGQVLRAQGRYAEAISEYEAVLASDRNFVYAFFALGQSGSIEETIPLVQRAIRLSPRDPERGVWYQQIGRVHLLQSRTDEAISWLGRARNHTPAHSGFRADLASAYALNSETERAAAELAEARRLSSDDRYSSLARLRRGVLGRACYPNAIRSHVFRRPAQGRNAGGVRRSPRGLAEPSSLVGLGGRFWLPETAGDGVSITSVLGTCPLGAKSRSASSEGGCPDHLGLT
jgi:tetratricopeptide (TPR) repeat protein